MWRIDRERRNSRPFRTLLTLFVCLALTLAFSIIRSTAERPTSGQFPPATGPLPQTAPLEWPEEDLSGRMMDGAHRFVEAQIADTQAKATRFWNYDRSSPAAWTKSIDENRARLREILGVVDPRLAPGLERYGDDENPALVAETSRYRVHQVRWPVLDGVSAEGLLVEPAARAPSAHLVVVPDAGQTPEAILGLAPGLPRERQFARLLAESGCELLILPLINRDLIGATDPQLQKTQQTWREWLYRQSFHMGRHTIGYEVQKVLAAVDSFRARRGEAAKIGVVGYAEGGLIAFHAAAIDTRIDGALVSGYFNRRGRVWEEPIDRNVWSLLERFGDAEIASLVLPRHLVIEHAQVSSFTSSKGNRQTPDGPSVRAEFERIPAADGFTRPSLVIEAGDQPAGPVSAKALGDFAKRLGFTLTTAAAGPPVADRRRRFDPAARHDRAAREIERHVQSLVRAAEHVRDQAFLFKVLPELTALRWSTEKTRPLLPAQQFIDGARPYRERFRKDGVGVFERPYVALNPRTRKVAETDRWAAWDVVLDVWPDVFAWGVLVVPKDLRAGRAAPGGRDPARAQRRAARHHRSAAVGLQRFRLGPGRPRIRRLCSAQSLSRRGSLSLAESQGQHHPCHPLLVHPRPARAHSRVARIAAVRGRGPHRLLRPELRWGNGRPHSTAARQIRAVNLFRRLQPVDAKGGGDGSALRLHAHDRMGDALLELGTHVRLRGDVVPDLSASLHGRARSSRSGRPRSMGRARVRESAIPLRAAGARRSHRD